MHLEPPPVIDVDGKDVSDEDHDSTFGNEYDMAAEFNPIEPDSDDEPANTTGTNIPHFPSLPSAPPTQAKDSTGTVNPRPLVPPSSTTTIPSPTQARSSGGSNIPHLLAPSSIFPETSTPTRSSTGADISGPLGPPPFVIIPTPPQAWQTAPLDPLPQLSPTAWGIWNPWHPWQMGFQSSEPTGPSPVYMSPSAQFPCVVRNSRITSFVFISSLSVHAGLRRETGL